MFVLLDSMCATTFFQLELFLFKSSWFGGGFGGWIFFFGFVFSLVGQVSDHKKHRISDSKKWSLLSKQEHIPGQMLAQAVADACLRGTFVPDQLLAAYQFPDKDVSPFLGHF